MKSFCRPVLVLFAAAIGLIVAQASAQTLLPPFQFQPTAQDVDPGVDHGSTEAGLPYEYQKQMVFYRSQQPPGTIIIDTQERHLYLIQDPTHAMRYGIGVGRDGFTWQGLLQISRKAEWPDWHPPPEMIERQPYLPRLPADRAIRSARGPCISAIPFIASTAPMRRRRSVKPSLPGASGWSTTT
jgi:lipoprotein-anchoring transpeptidase ErfK/SrfK